MYEAVTIYVAWKTMKRLTGTRNGNIKTIKEIVKNLNEAKLDPNVGKSIVHSDPRATMY